MNQSDMFAARFRNLTAAIWTKIARIDELKGRWIQGANLNKQLLSTLKKSVLVTSSGASTRIEGSKLTDEDIAKLLMGINLQHFSDRDKQEVRGYIELLQEIFDNFENIELTENSINSLHKELLKYADKDQYHFGDYKKLENKVVMFDASGNAIQTIFETTPPYLTAKEMGELVAWTNVTLRDKNFHPLLVIGNFIVEFLKIHPFQDGNGRLSRILGNFLLLKAGYLYVPYISHEKLIEDNKADYYLSLRKSQQTLKSDEPDIQPWLDFFLSIFLKQSEMAMELLSDKNMENSLSTKQLAVWRYFQSGKELTPLNIARDVAIARPTVNQILVKLLKLGKIEKIGLGRATRYRIK